MTDTALNDLTRLEEAAPLANGPKLAFGIYDLEAFTAWCAAPPRNMTVAQYEEHLRKMLTPADPFDRLVMDKGGE